VHHRALFDLGRFLVRRTTQVAGHLLDHQLDVGTAALVGQDDDVFETHQGGEDLTRGGRGRRCFLVVGSHHKPETPSPNSGGPSARAGPRQNSKSHTDEVLGDSQGRERDLLSGRCGTRTHDLSRVNPSWVVSVTWGSYGKSSSKGK